MSTQNEKFVKSLTDKEHDYLWSHVYRYDGVQGVSAKEQFEQIVMYVLNFLAPHERGSSAIENSIYAKALKMFE